MAEGKARCAACQVEFKAKKDGAPYAHKCVPAGPPPSRTCACGEVTTMGPFPGRHEETGCDYPGEADPFESPTQTPILEEAPHPDESPVTDHRKWCTRCKLLGHYSADCTTAVLSGGQVSVPVVPRLGDPALIDNACSAADGYAPHVFEWNKWVSASQCVACGEDNPVQPAPATHTGRPTQHTSPYVAALADEVGEQCLHLNGFSVNGCAGCGESEPEGQDCPGCGHWTYSDSGRCDDCTQPEGATDPKQPEPDPFTTPTQVTEELNVSGQPKARYEWYGKQNRGYLVKLPDTGDFRRYKNGKPKGLTRATTFNKAATDQNSLTDWAKRNVLIGASLRPDLVAQAHRLTHENDRDQLTKLVAELETAAGAKVSADIGTLIHELTERWDGDPSFGFSDVPAQYRELIRLYARTLADAGLVAVPGLIERTTYIPEFGGVVGTLDRVYYHEPSGQYVIGDVKTGKTLKYGMDEIETQEWIYAHGVNLNGVYDWNTDTWDAMWEGAAIPPEWQPMTSVSEDWGVVVHMPVQGDDAGKVMLVRADLQRGKRHAQVCHDVRVQRSNKPKPEPWTGTELGAQTMIPQLSETGWISAFSTVLSKQDAAQLWQSAYDAGVPPEEMEKLKEIADARLAELHKPDWDRHFSQVGSVSGAGWLWEEARKAGVEPMELGRLVGLAQQRLRELGISG